MNTTIEIVGMEDFLADVKEAGIESRPLVNAALQNSAALTQKNIRQLAPHKTGSLQRSVLTSVTYPTAQVAVQEKYGIFVEEGTKPHVIVPKNGKALFWKGAAHPYRSVQHPGTRAQPFFGPGVDASQDPIFEQFAKVAERLITIMAGK